MNIKSILSKCLHINAKWMTILVLILTVSNHAWAQPQNDDPCSALFLNVSNVCSMQTFSNDGATGSAGVPDPSCSFYDDDDIWFQVLVPAGGALIIQTEVGDITDGAMAIYTGDCNNLTEIACDDDSGPGFMPEIALSGLTPNSIIYIRFFTYGGGDVGTFSICAMIPPPPPANDECSGAVSVPVNADMNCTLFVVGSTVSALPSSTAPAPSCGATGINDDVWYSFVATSTSHAISLNNVSGNSTDMAMALYEGNCSALTELRCSDPNSMVVGGLTIGSTYYVRVWTWSSSSSASANFELCIGTPPPPPANDECSGAVVLQVNPDANCTLTTSGTTYFATGSTGVTAPSCGATGTDDDVWYSFVATNPQHIVSLLNVAGSSTDMAMAIYEGTAGCGMGLVHLMCSDPNTMIVGGLTVGNTYYVRVWTWFSGATYQATFDICIGTPPPPPANDECTGAIALTVNPDMDCTVVTSSTTYSATGSTGVTAPTCGASGTDDDVWFSFVATNAQHIVSLLNVNGTSTDMAMAIYEGTAGCGMGLVHLMCSDPNSMLVGNLTVGNTYYVRVWTWFSGSYQANFDICVGTPPPPQPFDEPCNAILLEVSQDGQCSYQQFNNVNATSTTGVSNPTCSYYQGGDVWFKLEVPCSGSVIINTNTGTITDGGMAIYSGTCDNLTQIACDDDGSENGLMPKIVANNLTPGDTIWVRFWEYGNDNQGTFSICATIPPPPPPAADCATALPFCTSTTPTTVPNITDQPSLGGSGPYGCLYTIPNPTYYYLQIQNPGDISIQISQTSTTGTGLDVDFIVWGPFASLDAACLGIDATMIVDCSYSINAVEVADIPNAQVGEFYLFLVTNYSNQPGTITYQQIGGTGLSNCAVVCDITATNSSPVCASGSLDLYSTTIPSATYEWSGPYCFESTDQNPTAVSAPPTPGTYVYTVIATDPNGTRCVDTTLVTVVAAPDLGDDQEIDICVNADVNLTTLYNTTDLTTEWTIDDVEVTNPSSVSTPGLYQLIAVNTFGCADTANVQIDLSDLSITAEHTQDLCLQSGVILATAAGGDDPYTYYISSDPGNGNATGEFAVNTPAQYTITVVDEQLCEAQTAVDVTFVPNISVDAGPDVSIFSAETVQLNATVNTTAASVLWTPASGLSATNVLNPVASPEVTTTYTIEVTNAQGCIATDEITITVVPLCMNLRNAFSPNGDGINDMFEVYNSFGCLNKVVLHVYNRYGSKVFESKDYRNNWDGTYKGKPVPDGTYYAVVDYYLTTGKVITRKTDVTIIR